MASKSPDPSGSSSLILWRLSDYARKDQQPPTTAAFLATGAVIVSGLVAAEMACRFILFQIQDWHVLLEQEVNRQILARHIAVDCWCLFLLACMGWMARSIVWHVLEAWFGGCFVGRSSNGSRVPVTVPAGGYLNRFYTVYPEALRISMFFLWYQVKNLYDTVVWNDGPEYIGHHIFSIFTAWVVLGPHFCHFYAIFYFGLSEVSTFVLCILANFDDDHGVIGLGEAFPITKMVVGVVFVILFIICRCILWPIFSYHFCVDTYRTLKDPDARTTVVRKRWLKFLCGSLTFMSILQVAWLGQIFFIAKDEFTKMGLL